MVKFKFHFFVCPCKPLKTSMFLKKISKFWIFLIYPGSLFQYTGVITAKARSPYFEYFVLGTFSVNAPPSIAKRDG